MKTIIKILLLCIGFMFSPFTSMSFADDIVKFRLEIKPNQQKVEAHIDGDEHKEINIKAEYIKLNTITNNHQIKVTITNNSGMILYHQLALIDKVENSEVKYPDSRTDYVKIDDGKQITKTLPYYNYGNIKANQATPREWYISNTGKDEIEVEGYIIGKEIPVVLDPKIAATNAGVAQTLTAYITALRDNDLNGVLAVVIKPSSYFGKDVPAEYRNDYNTYPSYFLVYYSNILFPKAIGINGNICSLEYDWIDPDDGSKNLWILELQKDTTQWWITK